jgi:uncharacterized membrane protein
MSFLRFIMVLSLVVWIGGLIFFAFVLAPTAFTVLPDTHLAGNVVGRALGKLHWIAIVSAVVFLISSLLYSRFTIGTAHVFAIRNVLIVVMLALTLFSPRSRSTIRRACSSTRCTCGPRAWKARFCCWG